MVMVKKKSHAKAKHVSHNKTHILVKKSIATYAVLVFVLFFTTALATHAIYDLAKTRHNNERRERISSVYTNLNLDNSYRPAKSDVFGDKRPYEWGKGRSFSSSIEYGHNDTPANTRAELTKKIEQSGFKKIGEAYENSASPQIHFKNDDGVYLRLTVTSGYVHNSLVYGNFAEGETFLDHKDEAPSYVTIKVNLDDNNE